MKKFKSKIIISLILALSITTMLSTSVFAYPSHDSFRIGSYDFNGDVYINADGATATSSYGTIAGLQVKVEYWYRYGSNGNTYTSMKNQNSDASTKVSCYATYDSGHITNRESVRAVGKHHISYNGVTKSLDTEIKF